MIMLKCQRKNSKINTKNMEQYMIIRKATLEDLDKITMVEAECFPEAEAATQMRLTFKNTGSI